MRRGLRALSWVLIAAGGLLLVEAAATVLWQEPVTSLWASFEQRRLDDELAELEAQTPVVESRPIAEDDAGGRDPARAAAAGRRAVRRRLAAAARRLDRRARNGAPIGRLTIRRMNLSTVVVAGTDGAELRLGPGHYPATPLPGMRGTVAIAGHRTTYGAPFRHLDRARPGDRIELRMPYGRFTYGVRRSRIVPATATWVTDRAREDRLVLSACHPLYSAAQRIVVFARLESVRPRV